MKKNSEVLIITHAGSSIGGGHIGRCFALCEGFSCSDVSVHWLVNGEAGSMLLNRGIKEQSITAIESLFFEGLESLLDAVVWLNPTLCVVDSYDASPFLLKTLSSLFTVLFIDDCRTRSVELECSILLNYNLNADLLGYEADKTSLLLGPGYALLRSDFWNLTPSEGDSILIIPGASDMLNAGKSFAGWWKTSYPPAELVLGPLVDINTVEQISKSVRDVPNFSVAHNPSELPVKLASSRAVVCTSSVISYEALSLRKPLVVFQTADNQSGIGREIERRGLGTNLGFWGAWDEADLMYAVKELSSAPEACVNPRGACAAAEALIRLAFC